MLVFDAAGGAGGGDAARHAERNRGRHVNPCRVAQGTVRGRGLISAAVVVIGPVSDTYPFGVLDFIDADGVDMAERL